MELTEAPDSRFSRAIIVGEADAGGFTAAVAHPGHRETMFTLLRHLLAIAILPFTVVVLVPFWIAERFGVALTLGRSVGSVLLQVVGLALLSLGLLLFVASLRRFATDGKGTLGALGPSKQIRSARTVSI